MEEMRLPDLMHLAITADEQQSEEMSSYMMALYQNSEDQKYRKVRDLAGRIEDDPAHRLLNGERGGTKRISLDNYLQGHGSDSESCVRA